MSTSIRKILKINLKDKKSIALYKDSLRVYEVVQYDGQGNYYYYPYGKINEAIDTIRHLRRFMTAESRSPLGVLE